MSGPESDRTSVAIPRLGAAGGRHAFLLVLAGPQLGEVFPLAPGRVLLIGRTGDADIVIRDDSVSRRHCTVEVGAEEARLVDQGSANGTFVDGVRTSHAALQDGARIAIGGATLLKFLWTDEIEARWQIQLARGAQQDPLTGLYNRRHLEDRLGAELSASLRHGRPLSLLLADVDHFKAVNDRHGHLAGDEVLKRTALVLRDTVRKEDVLARHGGEEFVVLARETALEGGRSLAERLRRAVERNRCTWEGTSLQVTISIGVAVSSRAGAYVEGASERELFAWADRALYQAKAERNRVVALEAGEGAPGPPTSPAG
jgi:two-component system, cell cycle response regulator